MKKTKKIEKLIYPNEVIRLQKEATPQGGHQTHAREKFENRPMSSVLYKDLNTPNLFATARAYIPTMLSEKVKKE